MHNFNIHPVVHNPYSHLTAVKRTRLSPATQLLLQRGLILGEVLDLGCGKGDEVRLLRDLGIPVTGYDPHYAPAFPDRKFDTILCNQVLQTLLPNEQEDVLMNISFLLKPGGKAYITLPETPKTEGFRSHKETRQPIYQGKVRLPFPLFFHTPRYRIYEYWHYTWLHRGNSSVSPFLESDLLQELIVETAVAFAIAHPSSPIPGHTIILPKRLVASYFELSVAEQNGCWAVVNKVRALVEQQYAPADFSIQISPVPNTPLQTAHAPIELIPHYI